MKEVTIISTAEITEVYKGEEAEFVINQLNNDPDFLTKNAPDAGTHMKIRLGVDDLIIKKVKAFINEAE